MSDAEPSVLPRALMDDPRRGLKKLPSTTSTVDRVLLRCQLSPSPRSDMTPCWIFQGALMGGGYAGVHIKRVPRYGHRLAYIEMRGPIPPGLWTDHLCRVRSCCNPWHIELVRPGENTRRGHWTSSHGQPRETHCRAGHAYVDVGVVYRPNGDRRCAECVREVGRRQAAHKKAARRATGRGRRTADEIAAGVPLLRLASVGDH